MPRKMQTPRSVESAPEPMPSASRSGGRPSTFTTVVICAVLLTALILGAKNLLHPSDSKMMPSSDHPTGAIAEDDIQGLIKKVSAHIVVKSDESPTVATIQDADMLRTQNAQFYKDAQNGDRLLIWSDKAVLYSTSKDVILAVLPVSVASNGSQTTTATSTMQAPEPEVATIEVRNGSKTPGLARTMADRLKASGLTVLSPTDAKVKTYETTVIIKANDKPLPETLKTLLAVTKASVIEAPAAEGQLKGDFVVIVGADFTP